MKYKIAELEQKIIGLLKERGFSDDDAQTITKPVMWAEMHGNKQGLLKLVAEPGMQKYSSLRPIAIDKDSASTAMIDGGENHAMIVVQEMIAKASRMLQGSGVAVVGSHGTHSSSGALTYYAEQLSEKGYIAMLMCRTPPFVAPFGSSERLFGTNPFALSLPCNQGSFSFDIATAASAFYNLMTSSVEGKKIDPRLFIDAAGQPTENPDDVLTGGGAALPFDGGYKGSALGMMVELLAGPLVGSAFCDAGSGEWGHLLIAIDPENFAGLEKFKNSVSGAINQIRAAKAIEGKVVQLPGDHSNAVYADVIKSGEIEVSENVMQKLGWN